MTAEKATFFSKGYVVHIIVRGHNLSECRVSTGDD